MHSNGQKRYRLQAEVLQLIDLAPQNPDHYIVEINAPEIAASSRPGQFVHIMPPVDEPILRRPFSLYAVDSEQGSISLLYRIIGDGTKSLANVRTGDTLDIIGPLGNGYTMDLSKPAVIAGGGVGIPPLVFLAQKFIDAGHKADAVQVYIGARNPETLLCAGDFKGMGIEPVISTEDGSVGVKGFITDALRSNAGIIQDESIVYSCGPIPMLGAVSGWAEGAGLKCYVSMESKLGCGIGACLGCSIPVYDTGGDVFYARVCCDGPAFESLDVAFSEI